MSNPIKRFNVRPAVPDDLGASFHQLTWEEATDGNVVLARDVVKKGKQLVKDLAPPIAAKSHLALYRLAYSTAINDILAGLEP